MCNQINSLLIIIIKKKRWYKRDGIKEKKEKRYIYNTTHNASNSLV
jgi:hypothetical protein